MPEICYNYLATGAAGFNPGHALIPDTVAEAALPWDWNTPGLGSRTSFLVTREWLEFWWYRVAVLRAQIQVLDPVGYNIPFTLFLERDAAGEPLLFLPGSAQTHGQTAFVSAGMTFTGGATATGWGDDPADVASGSVTVRWFVKQVIGSLVEPVVIQTPHLSISHLGYAVGVTIEGSIGYEAGSEYAQTLRSYNDPAQFDQVTNTIIDPTIVTTGSFFPDHGGGGFSVRVYSPSEDAAATDAILNIIPVGFFSWGGRFNPGTGLPM